MAMPPPRIRVNGLQLKQVNRSDRVRWAATNTGATLDEKVTDNNQIQKQNVFLFPLFGFTPSASVTPIPIAEIADRCQRRQGTRVRATAMTHAATQNNHPSFHIQKSQSIAELAIPFSPLFFFIIRGPSLCRLDEGSNECSKFKSCLFSHLSTFCRNPRRR